MTQDEINEYRKSIQSVSVATRRQTLAALESQIEHIQRKWWKSADDRERMALYEARAAIIRSETGW